MTAVGTAVFAGNPPVGSVEWHNLRRETINGSEIAPILGISPYESGFSLWHRKAGSIGEVEQIPEMYWGTLLEDVIREEFNRRHAITDGFHALKTGLYRHATRPWQGGGPDGIVWPLVLEHPQAGPDALLECKTARLADGWGEPGTDEIPVYYRAQCLWYLDVFGLELCHVAVLISGSDYREYQVRYDPAEVAVMRTAGYEFLESLATNIAPALDGHDATYQAVKALHPDIDPLTVELPSEVACRYLAALAGYADAQVEKRHASAQVITTMGSAQHATYNTERIASRVGTTTPPHLRAVNGAAGIHRRNAA